VRSPRVESREEPAHESECHGGLFCCGWFCTMSLGATKPARQPPQHPLMAFPLLLGPLQDVNVMLKKNQKLSRCRESLRLLEIYCQELLKTKARISQGEDVVHFFEAQSRDMDPSFPEDSIVILPSEMGPGKKETPLPPSATITQPVVSQSYRCIEAYETKDTSNRLFRATKGEILEVLMKDKTGWWLVENYWKQIAWFPAPYLEETEEAAATEETEETGESGQVSQVTLMLSHRGEHQEGALGAESGHLSPLPKGCLCQPPSTWCLPAALGYNSRISPSFIQLCWLGLMGETDSPKHLEANPLM
uniref:SH3 domain-containing protein n=1 Tax=Podarcis muralis TaxID=64176 RepID=A0A670JSV7_PODMU